MINGKSVFGFLSFAFFIFSSIFGVETAEVLELDPLLVQAVKQNDMVWVQRLLQEGVNPDLRDKENNNALHWAAYLGNLDAVQEIMNVQGEDDNTVSLIDKKGKAGYTALMRAVQQGHLEMVYLLLTFNADAKITGDRKYSSLHVAAEQGNSKIIGVLLEEGVAVDSEDGVFRTPLIVAAACKKYNAMKMLLQNGADVNHEDILYRNALYYVMENEYKDGEELLLAHGGKDRHYFINNVFIFIKKSLKNFF